MKHENKVNAEIFVKTIIEPDGSHNIESTISGEECDIAVAIAILTSNLIVAGFPTDKIMAAVVYGIEHHEELQEDRIN